MNIFKSVKNRGYEFIYKFFLLPKNIYFNFRVLPFEQARHLPFFVNYGVKIEEIHKGCLELNVDKISKYMISFGRGGSEGIALMERGIFSVKPGAKVIFNGAAQFHAGSRLWIDEKGYVEFGRDFSANRNFTLFYNNKISFGNDCMIGWNVQIIDGNAHMMLYNEIPKESKSVIKIGDHVWIGAECKICRGVTIGDNSVVAYGSTITAGSFDSNVLIGGYPAKEIRKGVNWRK